MTSYSFQRYNILCLVDIVIVRRAEEENLLINISSEREFARNGNGRIKGLLQHPAFLMHRTVLLYPGTGFS